MNIVFTQTADLYRLNTESANPSREKMVRIFQGLKVNIQPAGLEYVATMPEGAIGKLFKCFTTYSGCQIGMRLVSSGSATISGMVYEVTGVEPWEGPGGKHWELLVRKSTQ